MRQGENQRQNFLNKKDSCLRNRQPLKWFRPLILLSIIAMLVSLESAKGQANFSITVFSGGRQSFLGFGESQGDGGWENMPQPARDQMTDLVYRDLKVKIFRLWLDSGSEETVDSMTNQFYLRWIGSRAISEITRRGADLLLLAPARGESAPKEPIAEYAAKLAEVVLRIKKAWGIEINGTGLGNEPQGWQTNQISDGVRYLRTELDKRGLASVKIVAPESANNDRDFIAKANAIHADSNAWDGLTGIASHSYNNAVTASQESIKRDKQFWITEASDNGHEDSEDENRACTLAARFLNDMNHQVEFWVHFIGFMPEADVKNAGDTAAKMMSYDQATSRVYVWLKYYYFKQLLTTFDQGAVFRKCSSSNRNDMAYSFGEKPEINVAAAVNPDGTWGIGIVNDTGVPQGKYEGQTIATWSVAANYQVSVVIQELTNAAATRFEVYRSRANEHFLKSGTLTMKKGMLTVTNLAPKELVCLRSIPIVESSATAALPPPNRGANSSK